LGETRQLRGINAIVSTGTRATLEAIPGLVEAGPLTHIEALELRKVPDICSLSTEALDWRSLN
jgi:pyruvate/2-oxoglutarate dehydrogenase complex dihydrolipoamide dehydrogenase (E3) component